MPDTPPPEPLQQPMPWAAKLIAQAGGAQVPAYGSPEFHALPENSPARVAATVLAAEQWRTYWDPAEHTRRLSTELDVARETAEAEVQERLVRQIATSVDATARRMVERPPPPAVSTPVRDSPGWPPVVQPGQRAGAKVAHWQTTGPAQIER